MRWCAASGGAKAGITRFFGRRKGVAVEGRKWRSLGCGRKVKFLMHGDGFQMGRPPWASICCAFVTFHVPATHSRRGCTERTQMVELNDLLSR
jgi:hypothetical protein